MIDDNYSQNFLDLIMPQYVSPKYETLTYSKEENSYLSLKEVTSYFGSRHKVYDLIAKGKLHPCFLVEVALIIRSYIDLAENYAHFYRDDLFDKKEYFYYQQAGSRHMIEEGVNDLSYTYFRGYVTPVLEENLLGCIKCRDEQEIKFTKVKLVERLNKEVILIQGEMHNKSGIDRRGTEKPASVFKNTIYKLNKEKSSNFKVYNHECVFLEEEVLSLMKKENKKEKVELSTKKRNKTQRFFEEIPKVLAELGYLSIEDIPQGDSGNEGIRVEIKKYIKEQRPDLMDLISVENTFNTYWQDLKTEESKNIGN